MQIINSIFLTAAVNDWLATSQQPRILHVFDHACNLINEHKDVLSIVPPQIGNGPFNLVIDNVLFSDTLNIQSLVSNSPNHLNLGDLTINTEGTKLWLPHPDWKRLHARKDDILNQLTKLPMIAEHPFGTNYQLPISQLSTSLTSALTNADIPSSLTAVRKLAGLGIGLTPAGDDFILGAVLAAWIIHPLEIVSALAKEIANTAVPLTTSLSAAWLKSAGNGEAGILWHEFFDSLLNSDSVCIQTAADKILAVGETSGADALAGFIGAFTSYAERETDYVIPKHF